MEKCKNGHPWTPENTYHRPDGRSRQCRKCVHLSNIRYRKRHPDRKLAADRQQHYRRRWGMSLEDREQRLRLQGNRCAICQDPIDFRAQLDHDHATGAIREFLCISCNRGLGLFYDSEIRLEAAINYLRKHRSKHAA